MDGLRDRLQRQSGHLHIHLQGCDAGIGAGHLEIHIAQEILHALDVGKHADFIAFLNQAHGRPANRLADGDAGIHQRQRRAADRAHRGGAVGGQYLRDHAQHVGELVPRGQHWYQRPLGQGAVADLAPRRGAQRLGLAHAVGREVVVVEVALLLHGMELVGHVLGIGRGAQRDARQDLGQPPGKEPAAVDAARQKAHAAGNGADLIQLAPVDAHLLAHDLVAHECFGQVLKGIAHRLAVLGGGGAHRVVLGELGDRALNVLGLDFLECIVAGLLVQLVLRQHFADGVGCPLADEGLHVRMRGGGIGLGQLQPQLRHHLLLRPDQILNGLVAELDGIDGVLLRQLVGPRLDHVDPLRAARYDQIQIPILDFVVIGVDDKIVIHQPNANAGHGAVERDLGHNGGHRAPRHRQHVGRHVLIQRQRRCYNLDIVANPVGDEGPHGPVDQAADERHVLGRPPLAPQEAARNATGRVLALLVID